MFTCKNGCGYTNPHRGGMNLHEKIHCKAGNVSEKKQVDQSSDVDVCKHDFIALDDRRSAHQHAIAHGYTVVCRKCLGVE
jgi:hypothetical protein